MTTQTLDTSLNRPTGATARTTRIGAAFGVVAVVLQMAGFALIASADAVHTSPTEAILGYYTDPGQAMKYAGGVISVVGMLLLLPFIATMAGRVRDLSGSTAQLAGAAYVIICLPSEAAGAAALWVGAHEADVATIVALNALRAFSYYTALLALAAFLVAVGLGGLSSDRLARWMSWSAVGIGAALAAGVAVAQTGLADITSLVALTWIVVVSVALLRRPEMSADRR